MSLDLKIFNLHLKTRRFGRDCLTFNEIESTNRWLLEHEFDYPMSGAVVVADHQTAGRGRKERLWLDSPGQALLFSVLVRHQLRSEAGAMLSLVPSVALAQVFAKIATTNVVIELKWPNDLLLNGRKAAGVLIQSLSSGMRQTSVIGIGINTTVERAALDAMGLTGATSWYAETGETISNEVLLADLLLELETVYDEFVSGDYETIRQQWSHFGPKRGAMLTRQEDDQLISGEFRGLGDRGELLLSDERGNVSAILTGDILV